MPNQIIIEDKHSTTDDILSLKIDTSNIEEELANSATLLDKWYRKRASLRRKSVLNEARLDFEKAKLGKEMRKDPDKFGLDKVTDKSIEEAVMADNDIFALKKKSIQTDYEKDLAYSVCGVLDKRHEIALEISRRQRKGESDPFLMKETEKAHNSRVERLRRKKKSSNNKTSNRS